MRTTETKISETSNSLPEKTGREAQSVARLTQEPEVPGSIPVRPHTFVSPSAGTRRSVGKSMCTKYWLTAREV